MSKPDAASAIHMASDAIVAKATTPPPNANRILLMLSPVAVDRPHAAAMLGMSLAHFERHVQPHLKLVYSGRLRLVSVRELERWARDNEVGIGATG